MQASDVANALNAAASLVTILGVIVAAIYFPYNLKKREIAEENELLRNANDCYLRFLELQAEYPGLGLSDVDRQLITNLSANDQARQVALFSFLTSMVERAYYLSRRVSRFHSEWDDWAVWVRDYYAKNPNYLRYWDGGSHHAFGKAFVAAMNTLIEEGRPPRS
jgi:hypothetical protein